MAGFGLILTLFCLTSTSCPCQGQIISPGESFTSLNGATANLTWSFKNDPTKASFRAWFFTSSDGVFNDYRLARINDDDPPSKITSLFDVAIQKPGTLLLKNVNQTYDGTYRLTIAGPVDDRSTVVVFIAKKPNATLNCSSLITLNEGDNFTCLCKGDGGNPPAKVAWYKDGVNVSLVGTKNQALKLLNVSEEDNGTYTCNATSYPHENYIDGKSIAVIVYMGKPTPSIASSTTSSSKTTSASNDGETKWYIVVVSLLSGIIIGILLSYIYLCSRRKFRSRKPQQSNPEPSTSQVDSTYQELDLKKMDKEDNQYQSLEECAAKKDNVANDDDDSH